MATDSLSVIDILKKQYPNADTSNEYISHQGYIDALFNAAQTRRKEDDTWKYSMEDRMNHRLKLSENLTALERNLMLMQTYRGVEVVILWGMAVPGFVVGIVAFIFEVSFKELHFERPGVQLGIYLGLAASFCLMGIAAKLRFGLRKLWLDQIKPSIAAYQEDLNKYLTKDLGLKNEDNKLAALVEENATYASENWFPSYGATELNKIGFRKNALHSAETGTKSDERIAHGETKNRWAAFFWFENLLAVGAAVWLSSYMHSLKSSKPELPDWEKPWDGDASNSLQSTSASAPSHGHDTFGSEFAIGIIISVAVLAAIGGLLYALKQREQSKGPASRMTFSSSSAKATQVSPTPACAGSPR